MGETTACGRGDEDGPRPPVLLLLPGITSCVLRLVLSLANHYVKESVINAKRTLEQKQGQGGCKGEEGSDF